MALDGISNSNNMIKLGIKDMQRVMPNIKKTSNIEIDENTNRKRENKRYKEEDFIEAIETANKEFVVYDRRFEFSIHEKTKQIMVKVIDVTNDEIIREIPPEKILDMVACMWEIAGIIVDERI